MRFTATLCNFNNEPGYMFKQWLDNVCICSQFIQKAYFSDFCQAAGINEKEVIFE